MEKNDSRMLFNDGKHERLASPPIVVADLIRTPENIGSIIRLAANVGVECVVSIESEPHKEYKIKKTACMAWDYVRLVHCSPSEVFENIPEDYSLVALETSPESRMIYEVQLPEKMALVVGNEMHGIRQELLDRCGLHVNIPMTGAATSMNVSHATAVALFEWQRQNLFSRQ